MKDVDQYPGGGDFLLAHGRHEEDASVPDAPGDEGE
jgi:hypothetical protein